jgi:23S rRNA pseudouridine1911/1915/1917 synthase
MIVHAGSGATDEARNRGTLVNALLFHLNKLSDIGGDLRPGIVHRLDKLTSGLILVAKDDSTHRKLGDMFSRRQVAKTYIALLHGHLKKEDTTVTLPIARDLIRRTRMTTRRADGRAAVSHFHVLERLTTPYGPFTLVEVRIETGRTHQIRVHAQSLGHPVVGDTLYGAPHVIPGLSPDLQLDRNFLHAAHLSFTHPQTHKPMDIDTPLPVELESFLEAIRADSPAIR